MLYQTPNTIFTCLWSGQCISMEKKKSYLKEGFSHVLLRLAAGMTNSSCSRNQFMGFYISWVQVSLAFSKFALYHLAFTKELCGDSLKNWK